MQYIEKTLVNDDPDQGQIRLRLHEGTGNITLVDIEDDDILVLSPRQVQQLYAAVKVEDTTIRLVWGE